mmetsp:Transcript_4536/g.20658  ORF Transcript_4536/g.20658 Transcript_4536/m.20658 type:complete len:343 (+) Transcript_4536:2440-3468(+)
MGRRRCDANAATSTKVAGTFDRHMASQYARRTAASYRSSSRSPYAPDSASASAIVPTSTKALRQLSSGAPRATLDPGQLSSSILAPLTATTIASSTALVFMSGASELDAASSAAASDDASPPDRPGVDAIELDSSSSTDRIRSIAPRRSAAAVAAACACPRLRIPRRSTAATLSPRPQASSAPCSRAWHTISPSLAQWNNEFPSLNTLTCSYPSRSAESVTDGGLGGGGLCGWEASRASSDGPRFVVATGSGRLSGSRDEASSSRSLWVGDIITGVASRRRVGFNAPSPLACSRRRLDAALALFRAASSIFRAHSARMMSYSRMGPRWVLPPPRAATSVVVA